MQFVASSGQFAPSTTLPWSGDEGSQSITVMASFALPAGSNAAI
jgi:hypothetical protein